MLMRTDPFRDLDRLTQQLLGTNARPSAMLMDAWRDGDQFVVEFDLPGVSPDSVDLDVERNVLTVTAQRPPLDEKAEFLAAERPRGVFSRQLVLGDNLDLDRIQAGLPGRGAAAAHPGRREGQAPQDHHQPDAGSRPGNHHRHHNGNGKQRNDNTVDAVSCDLTGPVIPGGLRRAAKPPRGRAEPCVAQQEPASPPSVLVPSGSEEETVGEEVSDERDSDPGRWQHRPVQRPGAAGPQ